MAVDNPDGKPIGVFFGYDNMGVRCCERVEEQMWKLLAFIAMFGA